MRMTYLHHAVVSTGYNSPSVFLPIPGFPGYEINGACIVRNRATGHTLALYIQRSARRYYVHCFLGRVHRLLMAAICGRELSVKELVCHVDGNAFHNGHDNLKLGDAQQNSLDKIASNTNGRTLHNADVREIRRLATRRTRGQLARQFRVTASHIGSIIRGDTWANLP